MCVRGRVRMRRLVKNEIARELPAKFAGESGRVSGESELPKRAAREHTRIWPTIMALSFFSPCQPKQTSYTIYVLLIKG